MPYQYFRFGATQLLPWLNISQEIGTGEARIDAVDAPRGGAFDSLGQEIATRGGYALRVSGVITPPIGGGQAALTRQFDDMRAYLGRRERIWRRAGDGTIQWATARLVNVEAVREATFRMQQEISLSFFVFSALWHGQHHGSWQFDDGYAFDDGLKFDTGLIYPLTLASTDIELVNGGNGTVRDFKMKITAAGSPITAVQVVKNGETDLTWTGSIAVGTSLVIDFGGLSVKNGGVNAYSGLTFSANHKIDDWAQLAPGANTFQVIRTGGSAASTLSVSYDDGWL